MASWKKVLVSGSAGEFSSITASIGLRVGDNQTISTTQAVLTGSFTGSFKGDGSGLSGVTANFPSTQVTSLDANLGKYFVNTGSGNGTNAYITHDDVLDLLAGGATGTAAGGNILKNGTALALNASLANLTSVTSTTFTGAGDAGSNNIGFLGTASWAASASQAVSSSYVLSSSFSTTASFALNAVGGTLNISASTIAGAGGGNTSITSPTALIVSGTLNEIEVSATNGVLQIGLPNNVTIGGNLSVTGTTTTVSASSLLVTDKFIVLSSGSTTKNDGGIIIQSSTSPAATGSGFGFILDGTPDAPRWGVTSSLSPTANNLTTPDEYMVTAKIVAGTYTANSTAPTYGGSVSGSGNMVVDGNGDIWIYA
jgi:hypothetical protein